MGISTAQLLNGLPSLAELEKDRLGDAFIDESPKAKSSNAGSGGSKRANKKAAVSFVRSLTISDNFNILVRPVFGSNHTRAVFVKVS